MVHSNPFIHDLCKGSHAIDSVAFSFYTGGEDGKRYHIRLPIEGIDKPSDSDNYFSEPLDILE